MDKPKETPIGYMFDCRLHDITQDDNGHTYITIKTHSKVNEDIYGLFGQTLECAIKRQKTRRSRNANSYCWELCTKIAEATGLGVMDVYKEAIRNMGVFIDYEIDEEKLPDIENGWKAFGSGWFTEKIDFADEDRVLVRCYYGSSTYNTTQMATMLNYLVEEATDLGITVLSEGQRKKLVARE